ncbi:MAG: thiamine/thiamine pyrophosphate ABC transporter permease ThiP [Paracoccaceae bacterium]
MVLLAVLAPLAAVAWRADWAGGLGSADWAAVRFTLWQAALSALLSVALAVPVARALARRRFRGRIVLLSVLGAPFLLPVVVAVLGLLAVFGRSGWLAEGLGALGLPAPSIYGWHGVVLAHVFFNLPLAVRLLLQGWARVPGEALRLTASLGAPLALVERPMLRATLPGAALVIFLVCLTSFAVALILGGGPRATTVELAIYQALRFEGDLGRAALLALVQLGLGAAGAVAAARLALPEAHAPGIGRVLPLPGGRIWIDAAWIAAAAAFLALPLAAVLAAGLAGISDMPAAVWGALGRSVAVALTAAALACGLALALAAGGARLGAVAGVLPLAVSGLILGTGAFVLLRPWARPDELALPITALANALAALPFAWRVLQPAWARAQADQGRLAAALALRPMARWRWAIWPAIRPATGFALGLSAALSMGDLGVVALFAGRGSETLPMLTWQLMGSYRTDAAWGAALVLVASALALFAAFDLWGRRAAIG